MTVRQRSLLALLVAVHVACGWHAAVRQTVTHDEFWHLPVGLLHWRTGKFDHDVLNPPLTRLWSALPAALAGVALLGFSDFRMSRDTLAGDLLCFLSMVFGTLYFALGRTNRLRGSLWT